MSACENAQPITEVDLLAGTPPSEALLTSDTPWVARGYLKQLARCSTVPSEGAEKALELSG